MFPNLRCLVLALAIGLALPAAARCDDKLSQSLMGCAAAVDNYFEDEVWAKVAVRKCLTCHRKGGDAETSKFVLIDPRKHQGAARGEAMRHNRAAFARMAAVKEENKSRLLLKAVGELDHGGSDVLKPDSVGYRILADFVRRTNGLGTGKASAVVADPKRAVLSRRGDARRPPAAPPRHPVAGRPASDRRRGRGRRQGRPQGDAARSSTRL